MSGRVIPLFKDVKIRRPAKISKKEQEDIHTLFLKDITASIEQNKIPPTAILRTFASVIGMFVALEVFNVWTVMATIYTFIDEHSKA